jgi:predicted Holliday junction resolvase-like endonuclease
MEVSMEALLLFLVLILLCFVMRELVRIRRQVTSIRQSVEWFGLGLAENSKENWSEATRQYMEKAKQDLIRECKLDPQPAREISPESDTPEDQ